jgi:hypothetical protein
MEKWVHPSSTEFTLWQGPPLLHYNAFTAEQLELIWGALRLGDNCLLAQVLSGDGTGSVEPNDMSQTKPSQVPAKPPGIFMQVPDNHAGAVATASKEEDLHEMQRSAPDSAPISAETLKSSAPPIIREVQTEHLGDGHIIVHWRVAARILKSLDRQIVSPTFEAFPGCSFKLMVKPKVVGVKKGDASFRKARGQGTLELKLIEGADVAQTLSFGVSVGAKSLCGCVRHDFSGSTVAGLSKSDEVFDFMSAVDTNTSTFIVSLEIATDVESLHLIRTRLHSKLQMATDVESSALL